MKRILVYDAIIVILERAMTLSEIARLDSGCTGAFTSYGAGLEGAGGFIPVLSGTRCSSLGSNVQIRVSRGLGGAPGILLFSFARAAWPALGGIVLVEPFLSFGVVLSGTGAGNGAGTLPLLVPFQTDLVGSSTVWQGLVIDGAAPQSISFTPGLDLEVGR
jgi:hypothetical protein